VAAAVAMAMGRPVKAMVVLLPRQVPDRPPRPVPEDDDRSAATETAAAATAAEAEDSHLVFYPPS